MKPLRTALFLAVLLAASAGFAQADAVADEEETVVFPKRTVIDFTEVDIDGNLAKPDASYVTCWKKTRFRSLIDMRGDFRPELARSASKL